MSNRDEERDRVLEGFRGYLQTLAGVQMDPRLRGKLCQSESDIVQQTLWEAAQAWERLRPWDDAQRAGWLGTCLANNLRDEVRKARAQKRDVFREQALEGAAENSLSRLQSWVAADQTSPSEQARRNETALRVAEALARLPEREREAVVLKRWHGWSIAQIGERLNCTPRAVAGLLHRAVQRLKGMPDLRELLSEGG